MSRTPSLLIKLTISLVVALATIAGFEGLCRALGLGTAQPVSDYIANWRRQWQGDFYVLMPNEEGANHDGVRDRPHAVENPSGRRRVVFLGDSVTFGDELPASQSVPAILQRILTERGHATEVFNIALPGWSTRQERLAYERIARKYKPQDVILGFCLNDVAEMGNNLSKPSTIVALAYRHSNLVRFALNAHGRELHSVEELFMNPDSRTVRRGWELTFEEIRALAQDVRSDGGELSILVFPFRFQVQTGAPEPIAQRVMARFAVEANIRMIDLLPTLAPLGEQAFIDYDHFSALGSRRVAEAILESDLFQSKR